MTKKSGMSKGKSGKNHITNFYMETLVLVVVLTAVILVLTRVFAFSRQMGSRARILTQAVHLAENAAEAAAAADGLDTLQELLEEDGNVRVSQDGILQAWYDEEMRPVSDGSFCVEVDWRPEERLGGNLAGSTISVYWQGESSPVYTIETAVYLHGGQRSSMP